MQMLLIENEENVANLVLEGLRKQRYSVDLALNGECGWALFKAREYDLVLLDLVLPNIPGTELLKRFHAKNPRVPVIVLITGDKAKQRSEVFENASGYLTKPIILSELLVRIEKILEKKVANRPSVVKCGDLVFDRLKNEVRRNGQLIELTKNELALLDYLLLHKGRVCSRTMILDSVWDPSFQGLTNIVDATAQRLRRKIDEGHPIKLIRTSPIGYLVADEQTV